MRSPLTYVMPHASLAQFAECPFDDNVNKSILCPPMQCAQNPQLIWLHPSLKSEV